MIAFVDGYEPNEEEFEQAEPEEQSLENEEEQESAVDSVGEAEQQVRDIIEGIWEDYIEHWQEERQSEDFVDSYVLTDPADFLHVMNVFKRENPELKPYINSMVAVQASFIQQILFDENENPKPLEKISKRLEGFISADGIRDIEEQLPIEGTEYTIDNFEFEDLQLDAVETLYDALKQIEKEKGNDEPQQGLGG